MDNKQYQHYLDDMCSFKTKWLKIDNLFHNSKGEKLLESLGKYISENVDIANHDFNLKSFKETINKKSIIDKLLPQRIDKINGIYFTIATLFTTAILNQNVLNDMFGEPIYHKEFGEGIIGNKDAKFASYFININDKIIHIGFDIRGTSIDLMMKTKIDAYEAFDILIELFHMYLNTKK